MQKTTSLIHINNSTSNLKSNENINKHLDPFFIQNHLTSNNKHLTSYNIDSQFKPPYSNNHQIESTDQPNRLIEGHPKEIKIEIKNTDKTSNRQIHFKSNSRQSNHQLMNSNRHETPIDISKKNYSVTINR